MTPTVCLALDWLARAELHPLPARDAGMAGPWWAWQPPSLRRLDGLDVLPQAVFDRLGRGDHPQYRGWYRGREGAMAAAARAACEAARGGWRAMEAGR